MEQGIAKAGRRAGWSDAESNMLWETADEAQQQGLPLKAVFERIAEKTGRRPNSIRNYYYAEVRRRKGDADGAARFVPFTDDEVEWLLIEILKGRAAGMSVRACLQKLACGDHSLTLRYQNKYRALLKNRPDYVKATVERLNREGVKCTTPEVNHRQRHSTAEAAGRLGESAYRSGDAEIVRACETLAALIDAQRREAGFQSPALARAARELIAPIKDFLCLTAEQKKKELDRFLSSVTLQLGRMEALLPEETV